MTAEAEAKNLLEELGIAELPIVPKNLCKRLGIIYKEDPLNNIDGMLLIYPDFGSLIGVNSRIGEEGRKNFTCAHELGHFCMDGDTQSKFYCTKDSIENFSGRSQGIEFRADKFAAELLMPEFLIMELVNGYEPSWEHIKDLSKLSGTSLLSSAIRFIDLTEYACTLIVIERNKIAWFRKSNEFRPHIIMESRFVPENTVAYSVIQNQEILEDYTVVKADCWISGRGVNPDTELLEWTLPRNSYDQIFTLLFDEEGIAGWDEEDLSEDDDVEWDLPTFHKSKRK